MKLLISIDFDMIVESIFSWRNNEKKEEIPYFGNTSHDPIRRDNHRLTTSKFVFKKDLSNKACQFQGTTVRRCKEAWKRNRRFCEISKSWDETQWDEIGNGTPQGGGEILIVYGGLNHIQNSSWSVLVYLKDGKNGEKDVIEGIGSGSPLRVGGELFDE